MNLRPTLLAATLVAGAFQPFGPRPAEAQDDVELLGRIHGTTPPAAYYARKAADATAFTFGRVWRARNPSIQVMSTGQVPGELPRFRFMESGLRVGVAAAPGAQPEPQGVFGPPSGVVQGTFRFPLILTYFADTPLPSYTRANVQQEFFDGPNSRYKTIPEFYDEISGGRVDLRGETFPWVQSTLTRAEAAGSNDGLGGDARVGELIVETLASLDDGSVDWGRYDNDGPDGVPNSGDDDGFVDILTVMHSEWGAECSGGGGGVRIWSHKWRLRDGWGTPFVTQTPAAGGGLIQVDDYAIQPVQACEGGSINRIGVLAHELGHGFGLPDLYATGGARHGGIGEWGLMGSGAWGCRGSGAERPCSMTAWSKAVLGWVDVVTLAPGQDLGDLTIAPVQTSGTVYRADAADGSGEYFLLENRQRIGFDEDLHAPGLLIWQIDPLWIASRWPSNGVNTTPSHMGVWLRQADGRNDLGATTGGNRGDDGDPFPGSSGNTAFHVATVPSARTFVGTASGLTLLDIEVTGNDAIAHALTQLQTISLSVEASLGDEVLLVDGAEVPTDGHSFSSAPFQEHLITARGGEGIGGRRTGFVEWVDAPGEPRDRVWITGLEDADLVARFGHPETLLQLTVTGGAFGVAPGEVTLTPVVPAESDGWWFREGTEVTLIAEPATGFAFTGWSGDAEGQPNPALIEMDEPRDLGAEFDLTYGVSDRSYPALVGGRPVQVTLVAEDGSAPIAWRLEGGSLPEGVTLRGDGVLLGTPLEDGSFVVQVWATDSRGLSAGAAIVLDVVPPSLPATDFVGPLLGNGSNLTTLEEAYLDTSGNRNDVYDLGDFRAFFVRHPGFFESGVPSAAPVAFELPVIRFRRGVEP
jgi:M6 family metalloprotease-like protein